MGSGFGPVVIERRTVALAQPDTGAVTQDGDPHFAKELSRLYTPEESTALEAVLSLKARLRVSGTDDFWSQVTDGIAAILGAEMSFVSKRVLVDEQNAAIEMPPIGEPGACLMAAAFHYCDRSSGSKSTSKNFKYHAYGCPCAYMRHDKVFIIPERLNDFITDNPNKLPCTGEAYIAVPLFAEGKCFAHFGVLWSTEGAACRKLSWAFTEMLLHSLEDMILQRLLEGSNFVKPAPLPRQGSRIIPHEAVTAAQSLRPYAGSLSHELRTPMQGVVGMLDVMYATVQEAADGQTDPEVRRVFEILKENIEVVQDSSRRAVEAADNVVHAYDMDMSAPQGPPNLPRDDSGEMSPAMSAALDRRPEIVVAGSNLPIARPNKRKRESDVSRSSGNADVPKATKIDSALSSWQSRPEPSQELIAGMQEAEDLFGGLLHPDRAAESVESSVGCVEPQHAPPHPPGHLTAPGLRHTSIREVLRSVVDEGLKVGGRPDSAIARETDRGEIVEVRSRGSDGSVSTKIIEWTVDPGVPETMFVDEKDLGKLIQCVFLNALKFTDREQGRVTVHARISSRRKIVSIKISDNGPGIPAAFMPRLFQPFSQENGSLTRQNEGLGLGLMVAKGIARKLGGDLTCTRAETAGEDHGTDFEIKVPVVAGEVISRPSSPFGSPMPRRSQHSTESQNSPPLPTAPASPRHLTRALDEVLNGLPLEKSIPINAPPSPPSPRTVVGVSAPARQSPPAVLPPPRSRIRRSVIDNNIDRKLAEKYPLTFLVAEDNKINRKLLVSMLSKFGYRTIHEAHDGVEAVRQMSVPRPHHDQIDVVLMDLWMPFMDGYEATEKILGMQNGRETPRPTVLAVTADVTDGALEKAAQVGMKGFMTKPYKLLDLQRLILEYCARSQAETDPVPTTVGG